MHRVTIMFARHIQVAVRQRHFAVRQRQVAVRQRLILALAAVLLSLWVAERAWSVTREEFEGAMAEKVVALSVVPAEISLAGSTSYAQLVVSARLESGETVDVTRRVKIEAPDSVRVSPNGMVRPVADGKGAIRLRLADKSVEVPLEIRGQAEPLEPSFVRDVSPVMSKLGCSAGTCHGSKKGKNGFKLSLRGYDPLSDHRALTDDVAGRRFNRAAPEQSLMLLKPTGVVPHEGGVVMRPGDIYYEILRAWIAGGVKLDLDVPRVTAIAIAPRGVVIPLADMAQQMRVVARYSDGSQRDVTAEAFIAPSDIEILKTDAGGLVTALRRGEAAVLARYEGAYAAAPIFVMGDRTGYEWKETQAHNKIDELVYDKQRRVKVLPSGLCNDAEFIRRVSLDLTGLPPTLEEFDKFLADPRPTRVKRDALIDRLLASEAYVEHRTSKWSDMLQVNTKFLGKQGAQKLRDWIRQRVAENMPYDKFAHLVITASGSTMANPPAAYYKRLRKADEAMENTTQLFLAIRFSCNKCHDHPFERWTQDQYYQLAAYFAQVGRVADKKYKGKTIGGTAVMEKLPLVEVISDTGKGEIKHERTGQVTAPKFPYEHAAMPEAAGSRRAQLARWVTAPENPYFARSYVNRLWSYLLGVGLIEPVDDIRAGNPATNPVLLDWLTRRFIDEGFDERKLIATICKSRTYQISIATNRWNEDDKLNYSHAIARRLPAEVLYDTLHRATGSRGSLPGVAPGSRAAQWIDPGAKMPDGFLDLFGRPPRESACECERVGGLMLAPVLNLVNGPTIADAIADPKGAITQLVARESDNAKVVREIFLRILNRPPTQAEIEASTKLMETSLSGEELRRAKLALAEYEGKLNDAQADWEKSLGTASWQVLDLKEMKSKAGAAFQTLPDKSVLVSGRLAKDAYTFYAENPLANVTAFRLEVLTDKSLPKSGPGRAKNGNFVLNRFIVQGKPKSDPIVLTRAEADFSQATFAAANAIDGNGGTGWATHPKTGQNRTAVFETAKDRAGAEGTLHFRMVQNYSDGTHAIGRFRISVTDAPRPVSMSGPPRNIAEIVAVPAGRRSKEQKAAMAEFRRSGDAKYQQLRGRAERLRSSGDPRLVGAQDLAWALINSPAFLFNR